MATLALALEPHVCVRVEQDSPSRKHRLTHVNERGRLQETISFSETDLQRGRRSRWLQRNWKPSTEETGTSRRWRLQQDSL